MKTFDKAVADFARAYLEAVVLEAHGNVTVAAEIAGRNRTDFYKLLNRYAPNVRCQGHASRAHRFGCQCWVCYPELREYFGHEGRATGGNEAWRALDQARATR